MEMFILFIYYATGTEPSFSYFRADQCWRDAAIIQQETGALTDCRTAVMNTPVMFDTTSLYAPTIRPRQRPADLTTGN
jgi:hypothetical protein